MTISRTGVEIHSAGVEIHATLNFVHVTLNSSREGQHTEEKKSPYVSVTYMNASYQNAALVTDGWPQNLRTIT